MTYSFCVEVINVLHQPFTDLLEGYIDMSDRSIVNNYCITCTNYLGILWFSLRYAASTKIEIFIFFHHFISLLARLFIFLIDRAASWVALS